MHVSDYEWGKERNILELEKDVESHDRVDGVGFTVRRTVRTHC